MATVPSAEAKTSVVSIPSDTIHLNSVVDFSVYYKNSNNQYKKLLTAGSRYSLLLKKEVEEKGMFNLYIKNSDESKYLDYLQRNGTVSSGGKSKTSEIVTSDKESESPPNIGTEKKSIVKRIAEMKEVGVERFKADTTVEFPLYYQNREENEDDEGSIKQLLEKGKILEASHLKMLKEKNVKRLLIQKEDRKFFRTYVQQNTPPFILDPGLSLNEKSALIYGHGIEMLDYLSSDPRSDWGYARIKVIVGHMVNLIIANEKAFKTLHEAGDMEYALSAHSLNVALFSIGFGLHLGFNQDDLLRIGESAVFHDIGKSQIDSEIVDKAGSLKREEYELIKKHAKYGIFIMRSHLEKDKDILDGILYHHEHFDGSGYPGHLKGRAIPLFAQIVSLSDVYDAIARKKPYGDAHNSFDTLNIMMKEMGNKFDKKLLVEFVRFMGPNDRD